MSASVRNNVFSFSFFFLSENRFAPLQNLQTKASAEIQTKAVKDLISRLLPDRAQEFDVIIEPGRPEEENGYFQVFS